MSSHFIALIKSTLSLNILMQRRQKQNLFCGKGIRLGFKATIKSSAERMRTMENCPFHGKKINGLLMKGTNSTRGNKKLLQEVRVWKDFLADCHYMEFPNVSQFIQIMLTSAGKTSPVERGYTHLIMVAAKRRNRISPKTFKTFFLLATWNIPVQNLDDYMLELKP